MEVKKELIGDDKDLHPNNTKGGDQEPADKEINKKIDKEAGDDSIYAIDDPVLLKEKIKQLKEEQEKIKSNNQRGVQKILKEKKEAEEYIQSFKKAVREVRDDKSQLVHIHKENPSIAKEILDQYFDGISLNQFIKEELDGEIPEEKFDHEKEREKIRKQVEEEQNQARSQRLLDKYLKEVDEDLHEQIKEEFNGIVGTRALSTELVKKYFKVALSIVAPTTKAPASVSVAKDQAQKQGAPATKDTKQTGTSSRVKEFMAKKNKAEGRVKSST